MHMHYLHTRGVFETVERWERRKSEVEKKLFVSILVKKKHICQPDLLYVWLVVKGI